jgi:hypothetical protein
MAPHQNIPEISNTTGAGDAFLAAIAYSLGSFRAGRRSNYHSISHYLQPCPVGGGNK